MKLTHAEYKADRMASFEMGFQAGRLQAQAAELAKKTDAMIAKYSNAQAERDAAIKAVTDKAVREGWDKEIAYHYLKEYAKFHKKFWSWDVRAHFESFTLSKPHDARAWGHIYRRAVREGIIRRGTEERPDPTRHATMTKCWEVV